jgi:hypothetical protein
MITRTRLTTAALVLAVAFSAACSNEGGNASSGTAAPQQSSVVPQEFDDALSELENSMNDLGDATDRANNLEFPPVEINTGEEAEEQHETDADYKRFCVDAKARTAELELRTRIAVKAWYFELAESTEPMRNITDKETQEIHKQVENELSKELKAYQSSHPDVSCAG